VRYERAVVNVLNVCVSVVCIFVSSAHASFAGLGYVFSTCTLRAQRNEMHGTVD
jgi:hypothetical protein